MTNQHPITPPPELRRLWAQEAQRLSPRDPVEWMQYVSEKAAQWGADQELEACCEWLEKNQGPNRWEIPASLRAARRPKPPSLKKQALSEVAAAVAGGNITPERGDTIRLALEQLND